MRMLWGLLSLLWCVAMSQSVVVLLDNHKQLVVRPQGVRIELGQPFGFGLEGHFQATPLGQGLVVQGHGEGWLWIELNQQRFTLKLIGGPLGPERYLLRVPNPNTTPSQPLEQIQTRTFWLSATQLGYTLINGGSETLHTDASLLRVQLNGQPVVFRLERVNTSKQTGVLSPGSAEYGILHLPQAGQYSLSWLWLGQHAPMRWEVRP